MPPMPNEEDRRHALALTPVSRETLERLDRVVALLLTWQSTTNLIASSTIPYLWTRHIADSLQLLDVLPDARTWVDMGSGAGFPGLVLAIALAGKPGACAHLVESNAKKSAFLREAIRVAACPAVVHHMRIEDFLGRFAGTADAVTARALSPLKVLIDQSVTLISKGALGVFPKGQDASSELAEANKYWSMKSTVVPSRTDQRSSILVIHSADKVQKVNKGIKVNRV